MNKVTKLPVNNPEATQIMAGKFSCDQIHKNKLLKKINYLSEMQFQDEFKCSSRCLIMVKNESEIISIVTLWVQ